MLIAAVLLAAVALALAWPIPILLARSAWPTRSPAVALVLWQSIALAGGLAMIGSLFTYGVIPFGDTLLSGLRGLWSSVLDGAFPAEMRIDHVLALCGALFLGIHLLLNLFATFVRAARQQHRHRLLVNLLSEPSADVPRTRVLDTQSALAYCLPGFTGSLTVLSAGLLAILTADELRAVIAHERAHLSQRHHLVLLAFKSWHGALPWFPITSKAQNAVALLVEMLADDQACHEVERRTLARAIMLVGASPVLQTGPIALSRAEPGHEFPDGDVTTDRVRRLLHPTHPLAPATGTAVTLASVALVAVPTAMLLLA
ncbi:M56 family metallopeptidase [Homoserinimonas sp. OAct 916]|uniref:M56 family metallopeptidase n=1 Tax=Homoserinimonas sp. OAct 916 TaxID=2211450 RepID=UPI000DBE0CD8|nr:M56 family metallopeptidase [Homoserinimonas sp. OAct 916]